MQHVTRVEVNGYLVRHIENPDGTITIPYLQGRPYARFNVSIQYYHDNENLEWFDPLLADKVLRKKGKGFRANSVSKYDPNPRRSLNRR